MAELTDRIYFKKSNKVVKFLAEKSKRDDKGRVISGTYATKDELNDNLDAIITAQDKAIDSAKSAMYAEKEAKGAAYSINETIKAAITETGADVDTILASSEVADDVAKHDALIPNVDTYHAAAANGNVNAANANMQAISDYLDALVDAVKSIIDLAVFQDSEQGIQISELLDSKVSIIKEKMLQSVSKDGEVAGVWNLPIQLVG